MDDGKTQLKRELIKIVVDKLLIGVILLILGIFANGLVEKYRHEEIFKTELNKTRVAKIGEVWERLYAFESDVDRIVHAFTQIVLEAKSDEEERKRRQKELAPLAKTGKTSLDAVVVTTDRNRFWIGEEMHGEVMAYIDVLGSLMNAYWSYDADTIAGIDKKRANMRKNVKQIRDNLLGE